MQVLANATGMNRVRHISADTVPCLKEKHVASCVVQHPRDGCSCKPGANDDVVSFQPHDKQPQIGWGIAPGLVDQDR